MKRIRQALGLTQREFAIRLGVHEITIAKWETGAQGIRGPAAKLIALLGAGTTGNSAKFKGGARKPRAAKRPQVASKKKD